MITDATIGQSTNTITSLEPPGPGEDYDVLLSIAKKLDRLRTQPIDAVSPVAAFDDQAIDLLEKIEHNTALLLRRSIQPVAQSVIPQKTASISAKKEKSVSKQIESRTAATSGPNEKIPVGLAETKAPATIADKQIKPGTAMQEVSPAIPSSKQIESRTAATSGPNEKIPVGHRETTKPSSDSPVNLPTGKISETTATMPPTVEGRAAKVQASPEKTRNVTPMSAIDVPKPESKPAAGAKQGTKSQQAREDQRERQAQAELKQGIGSSIKDGLSRFAGAGFETAKDIAKGETAQDAIGTAIGGPIYGAAKDLKEAINDILDVDPDSMAGKAVSKIKGRFGKATSTEAEAFSSSTTGKRDKHGRFIPKSKQEEAKPSVTVATDTQVSRDIQAILEQSEKDAQVETVFRRKAFKADKHDITTSEVIAEHAVESHSILEDAEDNEEKRHKTLIRAITSINGDTGSSKFSGIRRRRTESREATGSRRQRKSTKGQPDDIRSIGQTRKQSQSPARPAKRGRTKGVLGKLGKFGKFGGMLAGGAGLLGLGGMFSGDAFATGAPDEGYAPGSLQDLATDKATDKAMQKAGGKAAKTPAIAKKLSSGTFQKAPAKVGAKLGAKGAMKLGGKAAGGLLRAVPVVGQLAALGMAGYDAVSGWNDREMQSQAFNLQEGQEATTGQKASSAVANVLDMGGLGTGMLNMMGMDVGTADIAQKIHEIGSTISEVITNPISAISGALGGLFGWGKKQPQNQDGSGDINVGKPKLGQSEVSISQAKANNAIAETTEKTKSQTDVQQVNKSEQAEMSKLTESKESRTDIKEADAKQVTADVQPSMLVSQVVTAPRQTSREKIQDIVPDTPTSIEEIAKHSKDTDILDRRTSGVTMPGFAGATAAKNGDLSRMIKLLEEIAGQGKQTKPEGRFRKPDSVIPQEYDDTVLTLIAHDRL